MESMENLYKLRREQAAAKAAAKPHTYCKPYEAGLASETPAVEKRLGRLLDALKDEINNNIVQGQIRDDVYNFTASLIEKLRADGWEVKVPKNNFKVKSLTA